MLLFFWDVPSHNAVEICQCSSRTCCLWLHPETGSSLFVFITKVTLFRQVETSL